jgi:uncharacterized membrane-anchored protein
VTNLFPIPENHPQRFLLHNEVHARASLMLELPVRASHMALMLTSEEKLQEREHLTQLCQRFGAAPPAKEADHYSALFDGFQIRWEQHGEFSTYTFYAQGNPDGPFAKPALRCVPVDWLAMMPGQLMVAAHAAIIAAGTDSKSDSDEESDPEISIIAKSYFRNNPVVGSRVTGGAARVLTDFRIHNDGFSRFLIINHDLRPEQAGRLLHRLFEIEVYRIMALLAFPLARKLNPELKKADRQLYTITSAMTRPDSNDGELLDELTTLAAEIENHISSNHFRFAAAEAYYHLVEQRVADIREVRIQGIQTLGEFIKRRLEPAMNTCRSTSNRFSLLSERVGNASQLLRTKVDIVIERQNQGLLTSMALRAKMQFRMQQTVESISMVAITYYAASLVGAIAHALHAEGVAVNPELAEGIAIPFILVVIALGFRRIHKVIASTTE